MSDLSERIAKDIKRDFRALANQRVLVPLPAGFPDAKDSPVLASLIEAFALAVAREVGLR